MEQGDILLRDCQINKFHKDLYFWPGHKFPDYEDQKTLGVEVLALMISLIRNLDDIKGRFEADRLLLREKYQEEEREERKEKSRRRLKKTEKKVTGNEGEKLVDDLNAVYQLVLDRYQDELPDRFLIVFRVLWGDLIGYVQSCDEDKFWTFTAEEGIGI
ncbi:hypothetical protein Tco_1078020 [Tanacetum coccineum]